MMWRSEKSNDRPNIKDSGTMFLSFKSIDGFPARNFARFADIKTTTYLFLIGNGDVRIVKRIMIETSMPRRI